MNEIIYDPDCSICQTGTHDCKGCGDTLVHFPGEPSPIICEECKKL